ncbi:MAG: HIRAN domain-containing protein [Eubacteriales bacterium]|nr:HIRAN domain-containing protein [Eubacteriales bacterium]
MKIYFTIAGAHYFHGTEFMERGMKVYLEKEHDNKFDTEAIKVSMEGLGQVGHVANSVNTVIGESYSAGRIYDKIGEIASGEIMYVLPNAAVCVLETEV